MGDESGGRTKFNLAEYLDEIRRFPPLDAEHEVELAQQISEGAEAFARIQAHEAAMASEDSEQDLLDAEALSRNRQLAQQGLDAEDRMIEANLRLVVPIAERYRDQGLALPDLIVEGNFGLVRSVDKFDPEKGFRFTTYATWWIHRALTFAIADQARAMRIRMNPEDPEDPGGGSRVREPRRPAPSSGSGALELAIE
jgi:RNA polymerase primary sigma factor